MPHTLKTRIQKTLFGKISGSNQNKSGYEFVFTFDELDVMT